MGIMFSSGELACTNFIQFYQWNTLAQSLSDETGFPNTPKEFLTWKHRFPLFAKMLLTIATPRTIIALEEVDSDSYDEFLELFTVGGFSGIWTPKNTTDGTVRDGSAIFYHSDFDSLLVRSVQLGKDASQNAIYSRFKDTATNNIFEVCVVHLKAKPPFVKERRDQVEMVYKNFTDTVENRIILGDFNDTPYSECIKYINDCGFTSAYKKCDHPATTAKYRKEAVIRCIDYILYKGGCWGDITELKELPNIECFGKFLLPNKVYPSDHMILGMRIKIKNNF